MINKTLGRILLTGASLAAMAVPAAAQEVSDEIVVTATGRTAAIQDVPLAVTALTGETLEESGANNLLDLQQLAPSLRIGSGQSTSLGTTARIRALGTGGDNPGFESAVGFFIDGVYRARAGIAISDLPEVSRVEVLRGPQGTLYGRNTSSGAISIVTAAPDFEPGAWLEAEYGDLDYGAIRAGGTVPLSDTFALRLDGSIRAQEGFMTDFVSGEDYNNQDRYSLRGQALWDIGDNVSLRVIADTSETDENCCAATILRYGATQLILNNSYLGIVGGGYAPFLPTFGSASNDLPRSAFTGPPTFFATTTDPEARQVSVSPNRDYLEQVEDNGISAQLDWDLGWANLTSITAQRGWEATRGQDIDFNRVDLFYREGLTVEIDNFTQEFRLQGEAGRINWLVGLFYSNEELETTDRIRYGTQASDYANALVYFQTALTAAQTADPTDTPRELFDGTSPTQDTTFFGGVDPIPSLLGALNPAFNQVYPTRNIEGNGQQADTWTQDATDIAVFTHNEISLSDALTLTIGVRYSQSEKEMTGVLNAVNPNCAFLQGIETNFAAFSGLNTAANAGVASAVGARTLFSVLCAPQTNSALNTTAANPWRADRDEQEFSGTASLRYAVNDDLMFYTSYARGYKAGGFNLDRSGFVGIFPGMTNAQGLALNPNSIGYEPEFTDSYEIGMRSTILGGTTFFNVTAFYSVLSDYQLNAFNGTAFITRNVPEAISQGVEIDILARLTQNLTIQGGINYTDAFNNSTIAFGPSDIVVDGTPLVQAPEWSVTTAITYDLLISDALMARFYVDARYDTEYQTQALGRNPISDQPDQVTVNGRISLGNPDRNWSVELWGRNLTDEFISGGFNAPLQSGTVGAYSNQERTYGLTLRARY